jgi:hypothetical protein
MNDCPDSVRCEADSTSESSDSTFEKAAANDSKDSGKAGVRSSSGRRNGRDVWTESVLVSARMIIKTD